MLAGQNSKGLSAADWVEAELRARIFAYSVAGEAVSYPRLSLARRRRLTKRRIDLLLAR